MQTVERIVVNEEHILGLRKAAEESNPFEACALLLGRFHEGAAEVTDIIVADNIDKSRVTFQIDPQILLDAYRRADEEGKEVVAVFHSHPAPPRPSSLDLQYMQLNPVVWVILSTATNRLEAYQLQDRGIRTVEILQRTSEYTL